MTTCSSINAGTREKDLALGAPRRRQHVRNAYRRLLPDYYTQLAIQGPKAQATLQEMPTDTDLAAIRNYWFNWGRLSSPTARPSTTS